MEAVASLYKEWEKNHADPRVKSFLFMANPVGAYSIVAVYLAFVYLGPKWMKDRKPFELKYVLAVYNFGLVLFTAYMFKEGLLAGWLFDYSFGCQPVDYSNSPKALRMARVSWIYFVSKLIELLDTVFFILRKKNSQVTYLHVFHHGALPLVWWIGVKTVPGGLGTFHGMVNAIVHIVMYTYYGLAGLGPSVQKYLWWKKYITMLQLIQFLIVTIHNTQFLFIECDYPKVIIIALQIFCTALTALFINFYIQTYIKSKRGKTIEKKVA